MLVSPARSVVGPIWLAARIVRGRDRVHDDAFACTTPEAEVTRVGVTPAEPFASRAEVGGAA
jgi:hypothetical protein